MHKFYATFFQSDRMSVQSTEILHETAASLQEALSGADAVFGAGSTVDPFLLATELPQKLLDPQHANVLILNALLLSLFFLYILHVYRYRDYIAMMFNASAVKGHLSQLVEDQAVSFRTFLRSASGVALLALLAILLKAALVWDAADPVISLPAAFDPYLLPVAIGLILSVWLYKRIATGIIAGLSANYEEMGKIRLFGRMLFVLSFAVLTPVVLLCGLSDPKQYPILFGIFIILLIIILLHYLWKSFSFFVARKISILQWFLYLCAVEIMPISFFILLARRGFVL